MTLARFVDWMLVLGLAAGFLELLAFLDSPVMYP